jgi:ketosteroid isomerase-like protein
MRKLLIAFVALAAIQLSPAFSAERDVVDRAKLAFSDQLQLICSDTGEYDWIAENAIYQYPLHDINVKLRVEGRDAISRHLRALSEVTPNATVENVTYYSTLDSDIVLVQYDLVSGEGRNERRRVAGIIEMHGDQIAGFMQLNGTRENLKVMQTVPATVN